MGQRVARLMLSFLLAGEEDNSWANMSGDSLTSKEIDEQGSSSIPTA